MTFEADVGDASIETAAAEIIKLREAPVPEPKKKELKPDGAPVATQAGEMPEVDTDSPDATPEDEGNTEEPTIAAPSGWNAEDQAWFETLDPARQEAILRREKGTQAAESRRQNEHTAALNEAKAERERAAQERQYFQSAINNYKHPLVASFQKDFADLEAGQTDLFRLAQQPDRWARFQAYQQSFNQIAQAEQALAQRAEAEEAERMEAHVATRNERLIEAKPDLKDPAKFEAYDNEVSSFLLDRGIPADRIKHISFEELQIVEDALNWRKAQKAKAAPQKQVPLPPGQVSVAGHIRTVPKIIKPGTTRDGAASADEKFTAINKRLRETGSTEDAAAAIAMLRTRKRA